MLPQLLSWSISNRNEKEGNNFVILKEYMDIIIRGLADGM